MPQDWFVSPNGQADKLGPLTDKELTALAKDGEIKPTDLVWRNGMKDWVAASKLKGLFAASSKEAATPTLSVKSQEVAIPPMPRKSQESTVPPPIPKQVQEWYYAGTDDERKGPFTLKEMRLHKEKAVIDADTLVWKAGMQEWQPAGQVKDIYPSTTLKEQLLASNIVETVANKTKAAIQAVQDATSVKSTFPATHHSSEEHFSNDEYGGAILAVPIIGIAMMLIWKMFSYDSPPRLIPYGTCLITSILAAKEASRRGMIFDWSKGTYNAIQWFFAILLLWYVFYPAYLYKRRTYGLPNHLGNGIVIAIVFVVCVALSDAMTDRTSAGYAKMAAMKAVVAKFQQMPSDMSGATVLTQFAKETNILISAFDDIQFNAKDDPGTAMEIVQLFNQSLKHRYSGQLYYKIEQEIMNIESDLKNR